MRAELDQVMYWLEGGRVVVWVEYHDALGKVRRETFYRPTASPQAALDAVARELAQRGVGGSGRLRKKQGNSLTPMPQLQQRFMQILAGEL